MDTHQILIDYEKCTGCKKCFKACYVDVIVWDAASQETSRQIPRRMRDMQLVRADLPGRGDSGHPKQSGPDPGTLSQIVLSQLLCRRISGG